MGSSGDEILVRLKTEEVIYSSSLAVPAAELHGILLSLKSKELIEFSIKDRYARELTEEGMAVLENGSPEYALFAAIPAEGADSSILEAHGHGSKHAFKRRWIKREGGKIVRVVDSVEDTVVKQLGSLPMLTDSELSELKRRNLIRITKINEYEIKAGPAFGSDNDSVAELTAAMITNFDTSLTFKRYNFDSTGNVPQCGALHPLMRIKEEIKKIFIEMGFAEMQTSKYVESSFWNFDSLFQPQNHPARDSHDTFFLLNPATTDYSMGGKPQQKAKSEPKDFLNGHCSPEYINAVKEIHSNGGHGSVGHSAAWSVEEASKNILRTHTTSVSARYLKAMAADFKPTKLFSIDKVFRNESVDATHLAEFHQVEGLIAGYNLGIADLMGILSTFFAKLGLEKIKFKPAFNPYTEPSMEVFGYHEGLGKWIEIGNSGIFRPEMLMPMGYAEDVCVIAWGLSLERPAMIKYGLNNIRDLVGHKVDINFIKNSEFIYFK